MQTAELVWLLAAVAIVWFWVDTLRARERAVHLGKELCRVRGLQLLDQTVALHKLTVARDPRGRARFRRRYRFEFAGGGAARSTGTIVMLGDIMESADLPTEDGRSYEHGEF